MILKLTFKYIWPILIFFSFNIINIFFSGLDSFNLTILAIILGCFIYIYLLFFLAYKKVIFYKYYLANILKWIILIPFGFVLFSLINESYKMSRCFLPSPPNYCHSEGYGMIIIALPVAVIFSVANWVYFKVVGKKIKELINQ